MRSWIVVELADGFDTRLTGKGVLSCSPFRAARVILFPNIEIAKKAGARIVSISPGGFVVASHR